MRSIHKNLLNKIQKIQNADFVVGIAVLLLCALAINVSAIPNDHESPPYYLNPAKGKVLRPNPDYSPDEVIRLQIEALARNDKPYTNAGIAIAFRFASPLNKKMTGPLPRFTRIVYNRMYRSILNHQIAHYGELEIDGDKAFQAVLLTTSDGDRVGYVFSLSKQKDGRYANCWMTDSVLFLPKFQEV